MPHRTSVTEFRIPTTIKGDTFELNDCRCVKIINVNGELRNEYESNLRSHRHYLAEVNTMPVEIFRSVRDLNP